MVTKASLQGTGINDPVVAAVAQHGEELGGDQTMMNSARRPFCEGDRCSVLGLDDGIALVCAVALAGIAAECPVT